MTVTAAIVNIAICIFVVIAKCGNDVLIALDSINIERVKLNRDEIRQPEISV
jgi:hypothetical protein